jgi:hypothetical protein
MEVPARYRSATLDTNADREYAALAAETDGRRSEVQNVEKPNALTRYVVDPETGCWRFTGSHDRAGYGRAKVAGKNAQVHVVSYELFIGEIPRLPNGKPYFVDHVYDRGCRYRDCFNPEHLEAVVPVVNTRRGRATKLTAAIVGVIKARLAAGEERRSVARDYAVTRYAIDDIAQGRTWREVQAAF